MSFFKDPMEVAAAKDALRAERFLEAAMILMSSPQAEHRSVRLMLQELQPRLVLEASAPLYQNPEAASIRLDWAEKCGAYSADVAAKAQQIAQQIEEYRARKRHENLQMEKSLHFAAQGRVVTALIFPAEQSLQADDLRADLTERQERFARYLANCSAYLEREEYRAAKACWLKAKEVIPNHPELLVLQGRFPVADTAQHVALAQYVTRQDRGILFGDEAAIFFQTN